MKSEPLVKENISLKDHTSWMVGGPAQYFAEPQTTEQLKDLQAFALTKELPLTILGGGTNVLINDDGVKGLVISLSRLSGIEIIEENKDFSFWALAGTAKSELLKLFLKKKLAPACFLAGLPGQVGGGVVMNAGVGEKLMPREFCEITKVVEVLRPDGKTEQIQKAKLQWDYRHCYGWQPGIITRVLISWPNEPNEETVKQVRELNQLRLKKQPLEWPSCGSVFRNPLPKTAGRLIEAAGLKGHTIGGAQISTKHANFIINLGNAKAGDISQLMRLCQDAVKSKFGIDLVSEVVKF